MWQSLSHAASHSASHFQYSHRSKLAVCNSNIELYQDAFLLFSVAAWFWCSLLSATNQSLTLPHISNICSISTDIWNTFFIIKGSIFYVVYHLLVYVESVLSAADHRGGDCRRVVRTPREFAHLSSKASQRLVSVIIILINIMWIDWQRRRS